jgi:hypothetical protein
VLSGNTLNMGAAIGSTSIGRFRFNSNGTKIVANRVATSGGLYQFDLSTAYDLTTAAYNGVTYDPSAIVGVPTGTFFAPNDDYIYLADTGNDKVHQYRTNSLEMYIGCVDISSENGLTEDLEYGSAYAANVSVTTDTPVLVVKQPLLIGTQTNTRDLTLSRISVTCSKKAVFKVWSTRDATAFTGGTFKSVNSGSYVECDSPDMVSGAVRVTAVTTSKLRFITAIPVEALVTREVTNPKPDEIVFPIVRGDYVVITCTSATAAADVVCEWGEHI